MRIKNNETYTKLAVENVSVYKFRINNKVRVYCYRNITEKSVDLLHILYIDIMHKVEN